MSPTLSPEQRAELARLELQALAQRDACHEHPAYLLHNVQCVDSRSGEVFKFELFSRETSTEQDIQWLESLGIDPLSAPLADVGGWGSERSDALNWGWQRELLDWLIDEDQTIVLKGRQLGVTWVACGLALWYLLYKPGTDVLIFSIGEDEAKEVVERIWGMFLSLEQDPEKRHLLNDVKVLTPARGKPSTVIKVEHTLKDGTTRISTIEAMTSSESKGHSRSAALVIFDELSRNEHARAIWKGIVPATADHGGKIVGISTANGMSDEKGDGNWYHYLWSKAGTTVFPLLKTKFLGWWLHPDRSDAWYEQLSLDPAAKAEQYPNDPDEAFLLSGSPYFSTEALRYYQNRHAKPIYTARFELDPANPARAALLKVEGGPIEVYAEPKPGRSYAIGNDVATGTGTDFSVAAVIDLHTAEPVAELYIHGDYEALADQLHFLGLWYNGARIAVEKGGGYGDTVIAYLRDGLKGRKPYPKIYRHRRFDRADKPEAQAFGFPMNQQTRPKVVSELKSWIDGQMLSFVTHRFYSEARTFVHRDTKPTPRHADGCNDDVVFAWGIALEMFSLYGEHEHDRRKKTRAKLGKTTRYRKLPTQS